VKVSSPPMEEVVVVVAASWFVADSSVWHATIVGLLAAKIAIITNTIIRLFITLWYSLSVSVRCTVFATTNPAKGPDDLARAAARLVMVHTVLEDAYRASGDDVTDPAPWRVL
jgi:hypothetical protein